MLSIKKIITNIIVIILSITFILIGYIVVPYKSLDTSGLVSKKAKVLEILDKKNSTYDIGTEITSVTITFKAKFTSGKEKSKTFTAIQTIDGMILPKPKEVHKGDNILCVKINPDDNNSANIYSNDNQNIEWHFDNYNRFSKLLWLIGLFFILIIIIGRKKGVSTLISLILTIAIIFIVYLPSILFGKNIYMSTIIVSLFIIFMSLILINGINTKTICAIAGNIGGLLVAGILALIMNKVLSVTGMINDNYMYLALLDNDVHINLPAVVWGAIVIGALGAVMDIAMSISSSMYELSSTMKDKSYKNMVRSGMNIGKDAIGTMTNTLILAYIGSSLATILLFLAYNRDINYVLNLEAIIVEIMQAIVGSIGILFAVPATVLLSAKIYCKHSNS